MALHLSSQQIIVWLSYKVTHTAELNEGFAVMNVSGQKLKCIWILAFLD